MCDLNGNSFSSGGVKAYHLNVALSLRIVEVAIVSVFTAAVEHRHRLGVHRSVFRR